MNANDNSTEQYNNQTTLSILRSYKQLLHHTQQINNSDDMFFFSSLHHQSEHLLTRKRKHEQDLEDESLDNERK